MGVVDVMEQQPEPFNFNVSFGRELHLDTKQFLLSEWDDAVSYHDDDRKIASTMHLIEGKFPFHKMYWWVHRHPDQSYPYGKSTNAFYVNTIAILMQLVSVILSISMLMSLFLSKDEADEGWLKRWMQWSLPIVFADAVLAMLGLAFFIF